jgi:V/A-type H+-transporting ATPase subunit E
MSETDNISGLETALAERAQKLAEEHLANGHQARERIIAETRQRLHIDEEREVLAAKAQAEHAYQQRVQAAELDLRAGLDRLRWELVHGVLAKLPARLEEQVADTPCYQPLLLAYLREGAQAIERDELVAQLNRLDWQRFHQKWETLTRQAAPGKRITLSPETLDSIGGVLLASADGNIRFDNTFEARMERMEETLRGTIAERLEPHAVEMPHG